MYTNLNVDLVAKTVCILIPSVFHKTSVPLLSDPIDTEKIMALELVSPRAA